MLILLLGLPGSVRRRIDRKGRGVKRGRALCGSTSPQSANRFGLTPIQTVMKGMAALQ